MNTSEKRLAFKTIKSETESLKTIISEFVRDAENSSKSQKLKSLQEVAKCLVSVGISCRDGTEVIENDEELMGYERGFVEGFATVQEHVLEFIKLVKAYFADAEDCLKMSMIVSEYDNIERVFDDFLEVLKMIIGSVGGDDEFDQEGDIPTEIIEKFDVVLNVCRCAIEAYVDIDFTRSGSVSETGKKMVSSLKSMKKILSDANFEIAVGDYFQSQYMRLITNSKGEYDDMLRVKDEIFSSYLKLKEHISLGKVISLNALLSGSEYDGLNNKLIIMKKEVVESCVIDEPDEVATTFKETIEAVESATLHSSEQIVTEDLDLDSTDISDYVDPHLQDADSINDSSEHNAELLGEESAYTEGTESSIDLEVYEKRKRSSADRTHRNPKQKRDSDPGRRRLKLPSRSEHEIIEENISSKDRERSSSESNSKRKKRHVSRGGSVKFNKFTSEIHKDTTKKNKRKKNISPEEKYSDAIIQYIVEKLETNNHWDKSSKHTKDDIYNFVQVQLLSFKDGAPLNLNNISPADDKPEAKSRKPKMLRALTTKPPKAPRDDPSKMIKSICPDLETALSSMLKKVAEIATRYHSEMIPGENNLILEFYVPVNQYFLIFDRILINLGLVHINSPLLVKSLHHFSNTLGAGPGKGEVLEFDHSLILNEVYFRFIKENILMYLLRHYKKLYHVTHSLHSTASVLEEENETMTRKFIAIMNSTLEVLVNMKNAVATLKEICDMYKNSEISHDEPQLIDTDDIYVSVWEAHFTELAKGPKSDPWTPATPSQLIVRLTSPVVSMNPKFTETVLMIYDHVLDPKTLVFYIIARFSPPEDKFIEKERKTIQLMTIAFLNKWIRRYYYHLNEELLNTIQNFCRDKVNPIFPESARNISNELENFSIYFKLKMLDEIPIDFKFSEIFYFESITLHNPHVIATHLTLVEGELYKNIHERELLNQNWTKSREQFVAQNVVEMMQRTNKVSFWVATSILLHENPKERIKAIETFISIANELSDLLNYNTLMGFIAGLMMGPISRLEKTFSKISKPSKEAMSEFRKLMNPSKSFKHYRDRIKGRQILVPFLGVVLSDLTFMDEGNPDLFSDGEVNLPKHQMVCESISALKKDQHKFNLEIDLSQNLYTQLYELPSLSTDDLYELSYAYEHPKNFSN